jgi:hypothetical protein
LARLGPADAVCSFEKHLLRLPADPSPEWEQMAARARDTLARTVDRYYAYATHSADPLVFLFLHEWVGFQKAYMVRTPCWSHYRSFYLSPALVQLALRLPAPMGRNCALHKTIIKRYLPAAYRWPPVNGRQLLSWLGLPLQERHARRIGQGLAVLSDPRRLWTRGRTSAARDLEALQKLFLTDPLGRTIREMLLDPGSLPTELLGRSMVQRIIDDHATGRTPDGRSLGSMVTVESWYSLVRQAGKLAAAGAPGRGALPALGKTEARLGDPQRRN